MSSLGRVIPPDFDHVAKFALSAHPRPPKGVPVVMGTNWHTLMDTPVQLADRSWIIPEKPLGPVRGGHCYALIPPELTDLAAWWRWYDQGEEGACVGFGNSRVMSLLNRREYQAFWLYRQAQKLEGDAPGAEGAQVRSGLEILRTMGHVPRASGERLQMDDYAISADEPVASEGISAYRWATTVDEILQTLGTPHANLVKLGNSWGHSFPHEVGMPVSILDKLLEEKGEAGVVTDR